jgi:hypothetical protein
LKRMFQLFRRRYSVSPPARGRGLKPALLPFVAR